MADEKVLDMLGRIEVFTQSSMRAELPARKGAESSGPLVVYCDPFQIGKETHDADYIFITHSHFDHYSIGDIGRVRKDSTHIIVPQIMLGQLRSDGFPENSIVTMTAGMKLTRNGSVVEAVPAYNLHKPFHPKISGWIGYIFTYDGVRVYVSGDTDDTPEAENVKCDIAIVPAGGTFTMNAKQAAALVNHIHPQAAVPTHYGTIVGSRRDGESFRKHVDPDILVDLKLSFGR